MQTDVLSLPLFALWTAGIVAAREENRAPSFKLLPLMALWANLEPGFFAGLIVLAFFGLEAAWQTRDARRWGVFAGFTLLAVLITPYGIPGLVHAARLIAAPLYWGAADSKTLLPALLLALAAIAVLVRQDWKAGSLRILLVLWLLLMTAVQLRNQMLLAAAVPLLLAAPLADAFQAHSAAAPRQRWIPLVFVALIAVLAAYRLLTPFERADGASTPARALAAVPEDLRHSPVFNERDFGGYLIFNKVRPFIDGRPGLYSHAFQDRYWQMTRSDAALLEETLARRHVRWTILAADDPAVKTLDAMPDWHRIYAGGRAVVHVRNDVK